MTLFEATPPVTPALSPFDMGTFVARLCAGAPPRITFAWKPVAVLRSAMFGYGRGACWGGVLHASGPPVAVPPSCVAANMSISPQVDLFGVHLHEIVRRDDGVLPVHAQRRARGVVDGARAQHVALADDSHRSLGALGHP